MDSTLVPTSANSCECLQLDDQILDPDAQRWSCFVSTNGLVLNPAAELEEEEQVRPWSEDEKKIFFDKFMAHPKVLLIPVAALKHMICHMQLLTQNRALAACHALRSTPLANGVSKLCSVRSHHMFSGNLLQTCVACNCWLGARSLCLK